LFLQLFQVLMRSANIHRERRSAGKCPEFLTKLIRQPLAIDVNGGIPDARSLETPSSARRISARRVTASCSIRAMATYPRRISRRFST
jgi:hypothetical protein